MIGESTFRKQKVRRGYKVECHRKAHGICQREWISYLRCSIDLRCDVDHGGKDDRPIGVLTCWVENNDVKNLEEKDFRPRISSHCFCEGWVCPDARRKSEGVPVNSRGRVVFASCGDGQ